MKTAHVKKHDLRMKIQANMETHQQTYEKAAERYRQKQTELLEQLLAEAKNGGSPDVWELTRMPVPENHLEDYRTALEMLEMETRDEVELDQRDFRKYVRDEWEWQHNFLASTASYLADVE